MFWKKRKWQPADGVKVILDLSSGNQVPIVKLCTPDENQAEFVRQWISRFNRQKDKGIPLVH